MFERTKELIQTIMDRDPAAKSKWEVVLPILDSMP